VIHKILGSDYTSTVALEAHNMEGAYKALASRDVVSSDSKEALLTVHKRFLPFASEVYNVSAKLEDYILVPTVIMPSELPNRNQIGFPYEELARFKGPRHGMLAFETWRGMPTFFEHAHHDHRRAKGIVFDVFMRPMPHHPRLHKVVCLLGFDRSKDPVLAHDILAKRITSYSMGAMCSYYTCSIDGLPPGESAVLPPDPDPKNKGAPGPLDFKVVNGSLAYWQARDITGFEVSAVKTPAYASATNDGYFTLQ
jgi:hypothetical protein